MAEGPESHPGQAQAPLPGGKGRRVPRLGLMLAATALSVLAGLLFASRYGPERLRVELERRLEEVLGEPCRLASLEVRPGLPIEFVGRGLSLWSGALEVAELTARVSPSAALLGELHVTRLEADGITLELRRGEGEASPPWFRRRGEPEERGVEAAAAAIASGLERLLERPWLADRFFVRNGRVELDWRGPEGARRIALGGIEGHLSHSRLTDRSELALRGGLQAGEAEAGRLELEAVREGRELRAGLALADLDAAPLAVWLPSESPRVRGRFTGVVDWEAAIDGSAALEIELLGRDLDVAGAEAAALWAASRASARARLEFGPERVRLRRGRIESGPLSVSLRGAISRPVAEGADLDLHANLREFDLEELPALLEILPPLARRIPPAVLDTLRGGRIDSLRANGAGTVSAWQAMFAGRPGSLRRPLAFEGGVRDLRIQLDPDDALGGVSFRVALRDDQLSLSDARGRRQGHPLPGVDLEISGVSELLEADLGERVPESDDVLLLGLPLLLSRFEPDPERPPERRPTHVELSLARILHPTLFWPVRDAQIGIDGRERGLVAEIHRATWAGVPLRGVIEWANEPQRLKARIALGGMAGPASLANAMPGEKPGADWARGTFEIERLTSKHWSHDRMTGRFRVEGSALRFAGIEATLLPTGAVRGDGELDLGDAGSLPYRFAFDARALDADALLAQSGLGAGLVRGRVNLRGEIRDRYVPGDHRMAHVGGTVDIEARDGAVRHDLPAVLALTLASDIFRVSKDQDHVRYDTCTVSLEAEEGVVRTEALELDGPDVRLFASGSLDLGHAPHPLDAEVVVFLFRPVDRALGSIPLVGDLLLGGSDNLLAAYFELSGPWDQPTARAQTLRSLMTAPMRVVGNLPGVVLRGIEALGEALRPRDGEQPEAAPLEPGLQAPPHSEAPRTAPPGSPLLAPPGSPLLAPPGSPLLAPPGSP